MEPRGGTAGAIRRAKLQSPPAKSQPTANKVQAGCPYCHSTNSIKALKGKPKTTMRNCLNTVFCQVLKKLNCIKPVLLCFHICPTYIYFDIYHIRRRCDCLASSAPFTNIQTYLLTLEIIYKVDSAGQRNLLYLWAPCFSDRQRGFWGRWQLCGWWCRGWNEMETTGRWWSVNLCLTAQRYVCLQPAVTRQHYTNMDCCTVLWW